VLRLAGGIGSLVQLVETQGDAQVAGNEARVEDGESLVVYVNGAEPDVATFCLSML